MANRAARTKRAPQYFDKDERLLETNISAPVFPKLNLEVSGELEKGLEGFAQEIHEMYSDVLNKLDTAPDILRKADLQPHFVSSANVSS